ncbi:MAG: FAD-dependent oxidoreductase, partial [Endomicrobium sp.]|nr:FAD-dependent oxidoreductase [Endomicrobium sp.]
MIEKWYHVVIIGAGHAGCEASLACAKLGLKTLMVTLSIDSIAKMSCNPAIGGIAKGQIVREIDALGGEIGKTTDHAGLQFKILNKSKGPAVWSPRAQCDKLLYSVLMAKSIQNQSNLNILQSEVKSLIVKNRKIYGVKLYTNEIINAKAVIVATGTF